MSYIALIPWTLTSDFGRPLSLYLSRILAYVLRRDWYVCMAYIGSKQTVLLHFCNIRKTVCIWRIVIEWLTRLLYKLYDCLENKYTNKTSPQMSKSVMIWVCSVAKRLWEHGWHTVDACNVYHSMPSVTLWVVSKHYTLKSWPIWTLCGLLCSYNLPLDFRETFKWNCPAIQEIFVKYMGFFVYYRSEAEQFVPRRYRSSKPTLTYGIYMHALQTNIGRRYA